jgi:hypothetical protein
MLFLKGMRTILKNIWFRSIPEDDRSYPNINSILIIIRSDAKYQSGKTVASTFVFPEKEPLIFPKCWFDLLFHKVPIVVSQLNVLMNKIPSNFIK